MKSHKIKKILNEYGIKLNFKQDFIDIKDITKENGIVTIDFSNELKNSFPLKKKDKSPIIGTKNKKFGYTFIDIGKVFNGFLRTSYGFQVSMRVLDGAKKIKTIIESDN